MLRLALFMLPGLLAGCGQTRFSLPDDREVRGHVAAADAERHSVLIELADGRTRWLSLDTVDAVELPGLGGIMGGAVVTVIGVGLLAIGLTRGSRSVTADYGRGALVGSGSLVTAAGLVWTGVSTHQRLEAAHLIEDARGAR